jgi:hypothetical protein
MWDRSQRQYKSQIHKRAISFSFFLCIILRVLRLEVYVWTSISFSSFLHYSVQLLNCKNCKRLREFEEIEISRQSREENS